MNDVDHAHDTDVKNEDYIDDVDVVGVDDGVDDVVYVGFDDDD